MKRVVNILGPIKIYFSEMAQLGFITQKVIPKIVKKSTPNMIIGNSIVATLALNFFTLFGEEESPDDKLIKTIKRSLLCIERGDYDKAEQILHLALRMAQDLRNTDGIIYVFDVMANLAMDRGQYKKAEKLFCDVMKMLFTNGYDEHDGRILHISSKIAHLSHLQGELEKALEGFSWTVKKIKENLLKIPADRDMQELLGMTQNWYGQLQIKLGNYMEAKKLLTEAYECLTDIYGSSKEESATILNNLSVVCVHLEDYSQAKKYLHLALRIVKEHNDTTQEGVLQANLGLIYLREGFPKQAKDICSTAWKIGTKVNNTDAIEQAEYCLNEIKKINK